MILLLALTLSLAIALVRGGKLGRLASVPLRFGWIAIVAFALQIGDIYWPSTGSAGLLSPRVLLLMGSYGLLLAFVGLNHHIPGLMLVGVGLVLNLSVMLANGGYMPIDVEALGRAGLEHLALGTEPGARLVATKDIILPRDQTRLWILSDILVIPASLPFSSVFSLGDVLLALGAFRFFQRVMLGQSLSEETTATGDADMGGPLSKQTDCY